MDEKFIRDLYKFVQNIFDLTSRVDERLKILEENVKLDKKELKSETQKINDEINDIQQNLQTNIHDLEKRMILIEGVANSNNKKWNYIISYIIQGIFIIIISYLIYLLNLTPPPLI